MHIHLPKPLHGWREFIHEIVIVVIGVLLALAGAEIIENWRWQWQIQSTRQSIADEIAANAIEAAGRMAVEDCLRDRIGELAARLRATNGRWTGDPLPLGPASQRTPHWDDRAMGRVYAANLVGWSDDAWETAKSSGVADHMSREEVASLSDFYAEIVGLREFQNQELSIESSLAFLSADQQLDLSSRNDALGKLGQLDALNAVNSGLSSFILEQIKTMHLPVDRARIAATWNRRLTYARQWRGPCVKDVKIQF